MQDYADTTDLQSILWEFRCDLSVRRDSFGGRIGYVVEDPLQGKFYQIGASEYRFLRLLTGKLTLQEALARFSTVENQQAFSQAEAELLIKWAAQRQLLRTPSGLSAESLFGPQTPAESGLSKLNPFYIRLPLSLPQRSIRNVARRLRFLFNTPAYVGFALLWVFACVNALPLAKQHFHWETLWQPQNWLGMFVVWCLLKAWHELGHGVACYRFGGQVQKCGVALICFAPVAFVDVTSAWRIPSKRQRIAVSLAGIYFEAWIAAAALLLAAYAHDDLVRVWACHVALIAGGQTLLVNLNPLVRFDGYYVLADLLEIPNLHTMAKQAALQQIRCWLGDHTGATSPVIQNRGTLLVLYFWSAAIWRVGLLLTGFLFLQAQQKWLGESLAVILAALWLALPLVALRHDYQSLRTWKIQRFRLGITGILLLVLVGGSGWWLLQPAVVEMEGIIEFSQRTLIRAPVAGFVHEVCVENNAPVAKGTVLLRLRNDELTWKFADLERKIQRQRSIVQSLLAQREFAKQDQALAELRALETHRHEVSNQLAALTICAPHAGQFIAASLDSLEGQYLTEGTEIAVLGGADNFQVLTAVPQFDWTVVSQSSQRVEIILPSSRFQALASETVRFDPSANRALPHEALASTNGGPIAMQATKKSNTSDEAYEPVVPVFVAYVQLPHDLPRKVRTGERASVRFTCSGYSRAARLADLFCRWFQVA